LWGSNNLTSFNDLTYADDAGWTQITNVSQTEFDQHVPSDIADPKYISVTSSVPYQYYAFKFADTWGNNTYLGVRRIVLQYGGFVYRRGVILNDGANLISGQVPVATTNGRLIDSGYEIADLLGGGGAVSSVNGLTGDVALTGTADRLTISAANVFDIASTYAGQGSITTVGALASGSLATGFTAVGATLGGTGLSVYAVGDILYADTTTSLAKLAVGASPDGYVLKLASGLPSWAAAAGGGAWGSITGTINDQVDLRNTRVGGFGITLDGQGGVVSTGSKGYITIPYTGTITAWSVTNDVSGSIQFDIKRSSTSIVGAGNKPLTSGAISGTAAVSGWTSVAVTAGDIIEFVCDTASTVTRSTLVVYVTKT
jgi:hypothetical protein